MKKGIVEEVDDLYIYVVFDDETRCRYLKEGTIKENDQVIVDQNNKIIEITKYDQELYVKIKEMEKKLDI